MSTSPIKRLNLSQKKKKKLKQSLTLPFFFLNFSDYITKSYYNIITIHIYVINSLYFLIIKLYKVILYLYCTHKYPHTLLFTQITL